MTKVKTKSRIKADCCLCGVETSYRGDLKIPTWVVCNDCEDRGAFDPLKPLIVIGGFANGKS